MPSYAVIGASGSTGSSLVRVLLQSEKNRIHAYCRSRAKLHSVCPEAAGSEQVRVFEGRLDDVSLLAACVQGTQAVFLVVSVPDNMPGCTIARDTASVVVAALQRVRARGSPQMEGDPRLPKVVLLSSASLQDEFRAQAPRALHWVLDRAASYVYRDLAEAERLLRAHGGWLRSVFVKPGALVHDAQRGHEISTCRAKSPLSFMDLAAGMVEVADDESSRYDLRSVSVLPRADKVAFPWNSMYLVLTGFLYHYLPGAYRYLGSVPRK